MRASKITTAVVFNFVRVSENINIAQFASKIFIQSMEVCRHSALFAETFNKEVSNVLCEKPIILVELLFELRNVVIEDSEDGKRTACKKMR